MNELSIPMNNFIKSIESNGGIIEKRCHSHYGVMKKLEVQVLYPNNSREFYIFTDNGNVIDNRRVYIGPMQNNNERNNEIKRLYRKENMTQEFISKVFGLSQPMVSRIVS